ncbi:hypothetical protein NL676_038266 [Syzygium grande]|nr:hypothetical protein NL676_038266 [Syzygium grande]
MVSSIPTPSFLILHHEDGRVVHKTRHLTENRRRGIRAPPHPTSAPRQQNPKDRNERTEDLHAQNRRKTNSQANPNECFRRLSSNPRTTDLTPERQDVRPEVAAGWAVVVEPSAGDGDLELPLDDGLVDLEVVQGPDGVVDLRPRRPPAARARTTSPWASTSACLLVRALWRASTAVRPIARGEGGGGGRREEMEKKRGAKGS